MACGVNAERMVDVVCYQIWRELMDTSDYLLKKQVSFWPRKDRALCMSLAAPSPLFHTDGAAFLARDLLCSCTWVRSCPWSPWVSPTGPGFPPRAEDSCRGYWVCGAVLLLWGQELWFPWFRHVRSLSKPVMQICHVRMGAPSCVGDALPYVTKWDFWLYSRWSIKLI